jgi:transcriptional regulator with XRE-family HTH domain
MFVSTFSERLKALRGEMKQAEFARKVGLAQNSYNRYESGERVPDIAVLSQLASRLGVSTDWLLGLDEAAAPKTTLPDRVAESRASGYTYCSACEQKDKTIASQAESIASLTLSLAKVVGQKDAPHKR